ncbi:MAG TPA: aldo/keto reductase, partial [Puia sp.]|nr:aldo/keto reductase [Puia sp.]
RLGRSEFRISAISFGCMSLGDREEEAARVVHRALDLGINFFDTADLYDRGLNEERVGRILRGRRDRVILATKVGNQWHPDGSGWDWNPRSAYIIKAVEDSLTRLQTDRIDLYQLHGGTIHDPIDETIGAFERLQQQGKILSYGLSSIRPDVIREYVQRSNIVSVMMQYSLLDRRPEESCLELLRNAGIGVLVRGVIAKGLLAGKPAASYLSYTAAEVEKAAEAVRAVSSPGMGMNGPGSGFRPGTGDQSNFGPINKSKQGADIVSGVGSGAGGPRGVPQTAIRFVLHHPAVTSVVVGLRTMDQVEEAVRTIEADPLTEEEMARLRGAVPVDRYEEHR